MVRNKHRLGRQLKRHPNRTEIAKPHWLPLAVSARREFVMVRPGIAVGLSSRVWNRRRKSFVYYSFSFKPKKKGFVL